MRQVVLVRRAMPAEVPVLLGLVEQYWSFEKLPGFDRTQVATQLKRLLSQERLGCGWLAEVGGEPAGYLIAVYVFSLEHLGRTAEIDEMFVLPRFRSRGLASKLLLEAEQRFVDAGCTNVSLQLSRANNAARAFYRRHGYAERAGFELLDKTLRNG